MKISVYNQYTCVYQYSVCFSVHMSVCLHICVRSCVRMSVCVCVYCWFVFRLFFSCTSWIKYIYSKEWTTLITIRVQAKTANPMWLCLRENQKQTNVHDMYYTFSQSMWAEYKYAHTHCTLIPFVSHIFSCVCTEILPNIKCKNWNKHTQFCRTLVSLLVYCYGYCVGDAAATAAVYCQYK